MNSIMKKIPITEYTSSSILKNYTKPTIAITHNDLKVTPLRLAIATAKCNFTRTSSWIDESFEAFSTFLRLNRMVANTTNNTFLLKELYIKNLRDFSRTNRIGELAQGINFLLAQEFLKIPTPVDFAGYCNSIHNVEAIGKTPDFIGCTNQSHYELIESKGSLLISKPDIKGRLREALKQCDAGEMFLNGIGLPNAQRKYGALAVFDYWNPNNTNNNSSLYFCDPENIDASNEFKALPLLTFYYKRLFEGFFVKLEFGNISSNRILFDDLERISHNGINFVIFNSNVENILFEENFWGVDGLPEFLRFGISENVLKSIESGNLNSYFSSINDIYEAFINQPAPTSENAAKQSEYEVYADGTLFDLLW